MKSEPKYPNESDAYRKARDELLEEERLLVEKVKAVAEKTDSRPVRITIARSDSARSSA